MVSCNQFKGNNTDGPVTLAERGKTMTTMMIKGVRCFLSDETAAEIKAELDAIERFDFYERQLMEEEAVARATGDWSVYSDLYKDLYGIRPRWKYAA